MPDPANLTPYKNRWVALAKGRPAGVGTDAAEAYRAAKRACPKDALRMVFVDETGLAHRQPARFEVWFEHDVLKRALAAWQVDWGELFLVGGAVRDGLLGTLSPSADLDLLVPHGALKLARRLADALDAAYFPLDAGRDVGRVIFPDHRYLDVVSFRGGGLSADLLARDFTINAMALRLNDAHPLLIDPIGGFDDLEGKIIRAASDNALTSDPLRVIRGARLAASLGFALEPATRERMQAAAPGLNRVSAERVRDEMLKVLAVSKPGAALARLHRLGALAHILPEAETMVGVAQTAPHYQPVFEHTLAVMDGWPALHPFDAPELAALSPVRESLLAYFAQELAGNLSRAALMPLIALLHDIGKPETARRGDDGRIRFWGHPQAGAAIAEAVLQRWRFSTQAVRLVKTAVRHHMRPLLLAAQPTVSRRAIHRFLRDTGDAAPAIAVFSLIDHLGIYPPGAGDAMWPRLVHVVQTICTAYFQPKPPPLLTGKAVMAELGLPPGPQVGKLLAMLNEAQAIGQVSTPEEAIAFLRAVQRAVPQKNAKKDSYDDA